jgi:membrane protein
MQPMIGQLLARARRVRSSTRPVLRGVLEETLKDRVLGLAAEIAFFTVLSIFPALLIATSMLSVLDVVAGSDLATGTKDRVTGALDLVLTGRASAAVESVESVFEGSYGGLITFAALGALVSLSGAWSVVVDALNLAYDTGDRRSWLRRRLLGLGMGLTTVVVVVVALTMLVVGPLLGRGDELADLVGLGRVFAVSWNLLRIPALFVAITLWLMFVYHYAPNQETRWSQALPGAITTTGLWLLATAGFHLYLRVMGDTNPVLGAFGGGAIIMIWAYLLSIALLVGGELNAVLAARRTAGSDEPSAPAGT